MSLAKVLTPFCCSFEALVILLREKSIVKLARDCVQRIHLCCTFLHGSPRKALDPEHVNVRVVLAAYMIAGRPTHVFESMGALEQSLYESAIVLTNNLESLAKGIAHTGAFHLVKADLAESFPTVLFEYLKQFKAWKVPDEAKLVCRIKHALVALYQAREHLPHDEPDDSKLKIEFRTQIERLRSKLQQIGGVDALSQFDETCKNGSPAIPPGESGGGGGMYSSLPGRMTNEQLAHELLMDPTFQLSDTGGSECENPVFHRIRASFHQVVIFSDFESPMRDTHSPSRRSGTVWSTTSNSKSRATFACSECWQRSATGSPKWQGGVWRQPSARLLTSS